LVKLITLLFVFDDCLLKAFSDHLLTSEHRIAEMSAKPEALTALANKIQTRPMTTVLRQFADHTRYLHRFLRV